MADRANLHGAVERLFQNSIDHDGSSRSSGPQDAAASVIRVVPGDFVLWRNDAFSSLRILINRFVLSFVACLLTLAVSSLHATGTTTVSVAGQFGSDITADPMAVSNGRWVISFNVNVTPAAANADALGFDTPFTNFTYSLEGSPIAVTPEEIRFYSASGGGLFTLFFGPETGFENGEPIPEFTFSGDQAFSGTTTSPTVLEGSYSVLDVVYSDSLNYDDEGARGTILFTTGNPAPTAPEPSPCNLLLVGLLFVLLRRPARRFFSARPTKTSFLAVVVIVFLAPSNAKSQNLTFERIYYPGSGATELFGINDVGIAVGSHQDIFPENVHGLIFDSRSGTFTSVDGPLSTSGVTQFLAINNNNQILVLQGTSYFIYDMATATFTPVSTYGKVSGGSTYITLSALTGLNDHNEMVGYVAENFVYTTYYGTPALGAPGSTSAPSTPGTFKALSCTSIAHASIPGFGGINNADQISGTASPKGFVCNAGSPHPSLFAYPSEPYTFGTGIGNSGIVAGYYQRTNSPADGDGGFIYDGTTFTPVSPPDAYSTNPYGINSRGIIVGTYVDALIGATYGFITVPDGTLTLGALGSGQKPGQVCVPNRCSATDASVSATSTGKVVSGEPIDVASGNMFTEAPDYVTAGQNPLGFSRFYNSLQESPGVTTFAAALGKNWRSTYDRYLQISSGSVIAERADGMQLTFISSGSAWTANTDVEVTLTQSGGIWRLTDSDDTVETYRAISATEAQLTSIRSRNGYVQNLTYDTGNHLESVMDNYGRTLTFVYSTGGLLDAVTTPEGSTIHYAYTSAGGGNRLTSVTYPTAPASTQKYQYTYVPLPFALTGVLDENGNLFASWTYDTTGRGLTSQLGGGANLTKLTYNADGTTTVENPLGVMDIYTFQTMQNVQKVVSISRAAKGAVAAAIKTFSYDARGYITGMPDWNGNQTIYVNNSDGLPTKIVETIYVEGSSTTRTTTIAYDSTWTHLPATITTSDLTTTFKYDTVTGERLKTILTDTTTSHTPYVTKGQTRSWTNNWVNALLKSTQSPNGNLVSFDYDGTGALIAVTNALTQTTRITAHTGGGLPKTIVDPNGVTTTRTYDGRQRLLASTISTGSGPLTASNAYDPAGNLTKVTLPDGSALTATYDTAHRLTRVTDLFHQNVDYALDAAGDRLSTDLTAVGNRIRRAHSDSFDGLGHLASDTGGMGQMTVYSYDPQGNPLTIADPNGNLTRQSFDSLNRSNTLTDPLSNVTNIAYDDHDRVLSVTDPNFHVTTYVYDGFGDLIQQVSPDSGTTVYHYDADGNLTSKTDARGSVTNYTYDPLDRLLTKKFPSDAAENVSFAYDQAGHGFGVGRLTSLTDQAGTLSRTYDERGNRLMERRISGATTLNTTYTYDAASRISSITYPSGWKVSYTRDSMGRPWQVPVAKPGGASADNAVTNMTYEPFGPLYTLTYGNGVNEARQFDLDYRVTALTDAGTNSLLSLTYGYDPNNNVVSLANAVSGDSQNLLYDPLDRLTMDIDLGALTFLNYTYDNVGNRLSQVLQNLLGSTTTTNYNYAPTSNRLTSFTNGSTTPVSYTATGNISSIPPATSAAAATLTYNAANRLSTVTGPPLSGTYVYDAFGQRFSKKQGGNPPVYFTYGQDGSLLEEVENGVATDYVYVGGKPIASIAPSTGKIYFIHADRLDTPQLVTDSSQHIVWSATYQPFGSPSVTGSITQNLRFPGQYFDAETGWNHNGFRDYLSQLGRYGEVDLIGLAGGLNPYSYVRENPATFVDRSGLATVLNPINNPQYWSELYHLGGIVFSAASGLSGLSWFYAPELKLPLAFTAACFAIESTLMSKQANPTEEAANLAMELMFSETPGELMWDMWQYMLAITPDQQAGEAPPLTPPPSLPEPCPSESNGRLHICLTHPASYY